MGHAEGVKAELGGVQVFLASGRRDMEMEEGIQQEIELTRKGGKSVSMSGWQQSILTAVL